jgi:Putative Ig domain
MRNQYLLLALAAILLAVSPAAAQPIIYQSRLSILTTSLPAGRAGENYRTLIQATGGTPPYTFTATGLPPGFTLDARTGQILGQPTANAVGNSHVVITVTDANKSRTVRPSVALTLGINDAESAEICGQLSLGANATLNGFVPFEPGDAWVTDISSAPLDPDNTAITSASGFAGLHLHHDWSSVNGGNYGIPYMVVDSSTTPMVPINVIDYADQSDVAVAPFPIIAPIEGAPADCSGWPDDYVGDSHVLVIDRRTCMLYETFNTHRCNGAWNSSSETIWDLKHYENRPWGWTSGDAAGLPIMPGLVRYDEIVAGEIKHAIRFTMQVTKNDANDGYFVEPATHAAGVYWGVSNVMGMRIRLKSSFDISHYSKTNQIILTAMKKYGMILADNGGYFFFQGVPDARWNDDDLGNLDAIQSSNFEVVTMSPAWPGWDSASAPAGAMPVIHSFTASAASVKSGTPVTLSWNTTGDSYLFIDQLGGVRGGSIAVKPQKSTTYTLNATNQYGRATQAVTVRVN